LSLLPRLCSASGLRLGRLTQSLGPTNLENQVRRMFQAFLVGSLFVGGVAGYGQATLKPITNDSVPLVSLKRVVTPVYPKLARLAHDSRQVTARLKIREDKIAVVELKGGNKYFDQSVLTAISNWLLSPQRPMPTGEFIVVFDFRLSEDAADEGRSEIDFDTSTVVVWGKMLYVDPTPTH